MFTLHAIQATFGDSFILEYGQKTSPRYILIDGGPKGVYDSYLKNEIKKIVKSGKLDLVILSHIDNDHVVGLVDLFADIEEQTVNDDPKATKVGGLWHNSFRDTIDMNGDIETQVRAIFSNSSLAATMSAASNMVLGVGEGRKLAILAKRLGIPINGEFGNKSIIADDIEEPVLLNGLKITIVGPTKENLKNLRDEWAKWVQTHPKKIAADPAVAAMADKSVPNLSSIMILVESDSKRILLTGDGRGDHLLEGLERAGLLDGGRIHVDVLKVQHHGSDRNTNKTFFEKITASQYVISADGTYGNPDLPTLQWIAEAAKKRNEKIRINVTNRPESVKQFAKKFPPKQYGYALNVMKKGKTSLPVKLV